MEIPKEKLQNVLCVSPQLPEQKVIVDYLNEKCHQIDNLIKIKQQKIAELKEHKKSLVYEYVTGKKKVPDKEQKQNGI